MRGNKNQNTDITTYYGSPPTVFKKIDPVDYKVNPFEANKTFSFTSASASTNNYGTFNGIYVNKLPDVSSSKVFTAPQNSDNSYQFQTYYSINHLFYHYKNEPAKTFGPNNLNKTKKFLYESASIFSIPQQKFGEKIQPDTFTFISSSGLTLNSDRFGNIFDTNINTGSFPTNVMFYEGFNEYFDTSRIPKTYNYNNVSFALGVTQTGVNTNSVGYSAQFGLGSTTPNTGYIQTPLNGYYDRDHNYAISFYMYPPGVGDDSELLVGKLNSIRSQQYPFKIEYSGSRHLKFSIQASEEYHTILTSSNDVNLNQWNHVVCQKTDSIVQIFVNGTNVSSTAAKYIVPPINTLQTSSLYINNEDMLSIGGLKVDGQTYSSNTFSGYLDEIRIYNNALTQNEITSLGNRNALSGGILQTNHVGNVFDKTGFFVISSPDTVYNSLINSDYTITYKSTVRRYEHSTFLSIEPEDFNVTLNPTTLADNNINIKSFATGSEFQPYITTVGLYNDKGQLLMIAKPGMPIKNRTDIDLSLIVKIDLDKPKVKF